MKTKIIATIGPACSSKDKLKELVKAGACIFRLNFSHGDASSFETIIKYIREVELELDTPITILQDLSGPKIRIGIISSGTLNFERGAEAYLGEYLPDNFKNYPFIPFDRKEILETLEINDTLVLADGSLEFSVISKVDSGFIIKANDNGIVTSRKGLALPGKSIKVPALTQKDKQDLASGLQLGIDAVALSYVQTPEDILEAKEIIAKSGKEVPVCAKLERQNAVNRLDDILHVADIIMVARGDLGIECPLESLPAMQKKIIKKCNEAAKPVIVATQMLLSMVNNTMPTRAETTDVANAVLDGADCVMLSEETAMGNHPVEAVKFMNKISTEAEVFLQENQQNNFVHPPESHGTSDFLSYCACLLANKIDASAIVGHSISGFAGRSLSAQRPKQPLHIITTSDAVRHHLNFSWGVIPHLVKRSDGYFNHLESVEEFILSYHKFSSNMGFVLTAGQSNSNVQTQGTNLVKIFYR